MLIQNGNPLQPLAHIMEFAVEMCFMFVGAKIGYGTGTFLRFPPFLRSFSPSSRVFSSRGSLT